jgi:hypothetical protein
MKSYRKFKNFLKHNLSKLSKKQCYYLFLAALLVAVFCFVFIFDCEKEARKPFVSPQMKSPYVGVALPSFDCSVNEISEEWPVSRYGYFDYLLKLPVTEQSCPETSQTGVVYLRDLKFEEKNAGNIIVDVIDNPSKNGFADWVTGRIPAGADREFFSWKNNEAVKYKVYSSDRYEYAVVLSRGYYFIEFKMVLDMKSDEAEKFIVENPGAISYFNSIFNKIICETEFNSAY